MSKWQKLKHRMQLATAYRWFLSLEKDIARMGIDDPSVVFDVGAHLGQTALHFRSIFKNAHIHSFEPVTANFEKMVQNIGTRDRISVNEMALGSTVGKAYVHEGFSDLTHSISSSVNPTNSKAKEEVSVETIDTYVARNKIEKIDLLKVDTEGHEMEVLKGADTTIKGGRVEAIFTECDFRHEDKQHTYFPDLLAYLHGKDFTFFGLYDVIHYGKNYGVGYCNALFLNGKASHLQSSL